ncbi:MAG: polyphosphate--glucose phosphotransferase [Candidatus Binatia bacterium]
MKALGVDVGGSGIKGAPVDLRRGSLLAARLRVPTPRPAEPDPVAEEVARIVRHFRWKGPVGCAVPAVVKAGVACTAANIDESWIGTNAVKLLRRATGCPAVVLNDADAAGIAEMELGAGKGKRGVVIMLTLGTGIGSAIFNDGVLLPNTEFGHLRIRGKDAEKRASDRAREEKDLSWKRWAEHVNEYLSEMEALFFPDLFIIGGGVSKNHDEFLPLLETRARVVPARLRNEAGIVGAALAARALL